MTIKEISIMFNADRSLISKGFKKLERERPEISKRKTNTENAAANYSLEECISALNLVDNYRFTPMMSRWLKEHFIEHPGLRYKEMPKIKISQSARCFLFFYNGYHNYECCITCAYFYPKQMNHKGSGLHPYCSFYESFLNKVKPYRDIYKSKCPTFMKGNQTPVIWTSVGVFPYNRIKADNGNFIILPDNRTLGIENTEFKSKRKKGEDITILKDAFSQD